MSRIAAAFERARAERRAALIPYLMAGDPSLERSAALAIAAARAGADIIELGVPFSDPIADGPVIQRAAQRALAQHTSLRQILEQVCDLRRTLATPIVLMSYYNPVFNLGPELFARSAAAAGVDGVIVPDLPPEESDALAAALEAAAIDLIFLAAPTSTRARLALIARRSRGFVYYVSLTGITGAQLPDLATVERPIGTIRRLTKTPVAVGFGIATAAQAAAVAGFADGVIVGSALVRRIEETGDDPNQIGEIERMLRELAAAVKRPPPAGG